MHGSRCCASRGREHVKTHCVTTREVVRRGRGRLLDCVREAKLTALAAIGALGLDDPALEPRIVIKEERRDDVR